MKDRYRMKLYLVKVNFLSKQKSNFNAIIIKLQIL